MTQYEGRKTGSANNSENSSNKAEIYGTLEPGAKVVQGHSTSPSSICLAPIARRLPDGHNHVNHAAFHDLHMVFIYGLKEHSSTSFTQ